MSNKLFNPSDTIRVLVEAISKDKELDKENLFHLVFKDEKYIDSKLRNLLSRTYNLLLKFYSFLELDDDKELQLKQHKYLINNVNRSSSYQKNIIEKWSKEIEKEVDNERYFSNSLMFNTQTYEHNLEEVTDSKRLVKIKHDEFNNSIDYLFIYKKLKFFVNLLNYQSIVEAKLDYTFYDEIMDFLSEKEDVPTVILIYKYILSIYNNPEEEELYVKLSVLLKENQQFLPRDEVRKLYLHCQNYCIRKVNNGDQKYLNNLFINYKEMVFNKTIYTNGIISQWSYKNIVSTSLRLGEFDWTHQFIEENKVNLDKEHYLNAYTYNLSNYYFYIEKYDKAIVLLDQVEFTDIFYLLGSKVILLKMYYSLEEYSSLLSLLDSTSQFINRKKDLTEKRRTHFKNFIKYLRLILKANKSEYKKLIEKIKEEPNISDRNWLISVLSY